MIPKKIKEKHSTRAKLSLKDSLYYTKEVPPKQCCGSGSGIRCFLTPGSGMENKSGFGIHDEYPRSFSETLETILGLKIIKFFDVDPNPGSGIFLTLDPG
jgi:hypothetical protein